MQLIHNLININNCCLCLSNRRQMQLLPPLHLWPICCLCLSNRRQMQPFSPMPLGPPCCLCLSNRRQMQQDKMQPAELSSCLCLSNRRQMQHLWLSHHIDQSCLCLSNRRQMQLKWLKCLILICFVPFFFNINSFLLDYLKCKSRCCKLIASLIFIERFWWISIILFACFWFFISILSSGLSLAVSNSL